MDSVIALKLLITLLENLPGKIDVLIETIIKIIVSELN